MRHTPALPRLRPKPTTLALLLLLLLLLLYDDAYVPSQQRDVVLGYTRSKIAAMPWPPPMHIVARP